MILESWEIRWFGEGAVPLVLQEWSEKNNLEIQPLRTDYYLMHTSGKEMGIKWREGNIQIKELISQEEDGAPVEHYKKWSFELKDESELKEVESRDEWKAVTKKRDMAKWLVENDNIKRIDLTHDEPNVFELEISAVMCRDKLWWTVGYEATGRKENISIALQHVNVPIQENAQCYGYAEWLENNF